MRHAAVLERDILDAVIDPCGVCYDMHHEITNQNEKRTPVSETGSEVCQVGDGFSLTLKYDIVPLGFYGTRPVRVSA